MALGFLPMILPGRLQLPAAVKQPAPPKRLEYFFTEVTRKVPLYVEVARQALVTMVCLNKWYTCYEGFRKHTRMLYTHTCII